MDEKANITFAQACAPTDMGKNTAKQPLNFGNGCRLWDGNGRIRGRNWWWDKLTQLLNIKTLIVARNEASRMIVKSECITKQLATCPALFFFSGKLSEFNVIMTVYRQVQLFFFHLQLICLCITSKFKMWKQCKKLYWWSYSCDIWLYVLMEVCMHNSSFDVDKTNFRISF